jgi:hypothetical protein
VGRATPVRAEGENIQIGTEYDSATSLTRISNVATGDDVFAASSASGGTALSGQSDTGMGVYGSAARGIGVYGGGTGTFSVGVMGVSQEVVGVRGFGYAQDWPAIDGINRADGTGVIGFSTAGFADVPAIAKPKTGVYGQAQQDAGSRGVWGRSNAGQGVRGQATSGSGVYGTASTGVGVLGTATKGVAFRAEGRAQFSTSGVATIAKGNVSVLVTPGVNVTAGSFVLLTPKTNIGSRGLWFTTNATANTFTIRLSSTRTSATKVAWLLLG